MPDCSWDLYNFTFFRIGTQHIKKEILSKDSIDSKVEFRSKLVLSWSDHWPGPIFSERNISNYTHHRCQWQAWLGRSHEQSDLSRSVEQSSVAFTRKLFRNDGSSIQLTTFPEFSRNKNIFISSDNTTVYQYINSQGGRKSVKLCIMTITLWQLSLVNQTGPWAVHIMGKKNVLADTLSRLQVNQIEWSLNNTVVSFPPI